MEREQGDDTAILCFVLSCTSVSGILCLLREALLGVRSRFTSHKSPDFIWASLRTSWKYDLFP